MQYIKLGPLKIPYEIKNEGQQKKFIVCGMKIPFSRSEDSNGTKYYHIFFLKLRLPFMDKLFVTRRASNFANRENWDDAKIREVAAEIFKEKLDYEPDLDNPKSMNEKIFWMKLNYHNPMVTKCCDKFAVKDYVDEKLGKGFVIPTIASWERAEDIDFDVLPDKFALKVNWSSGFNIIVRDKSKINKEEIIKKVNEWMQPQNNSYYQTFNWGYKDMKPVVYAEEYMEQIDGQLYDYKFFCCDGEVKFWFIATDRYASGGQLTHDFFDMDFNKLEFDYGGRAHSTQKLEKPRHYDEMIQYAEILSKEFPFVRVDFYELGDKIYVGEMTFYPGGGILPFTPREWDYKLGEHINIPK